MTKRYVITSTGTGQGKTLVTTSLCRQLLAANKSVTALKPVISGYEAPEGTDTALLLESLGLPVDEAHIERLSPWRYAAPLSPDLAAIKEGQSIDFDALIAFCQQLQEADITLIEGAGGLMSPLTQRHTHVELIKALDAPVILVAGSYLGCISHILTALEVLKMQQIAVAGLVLSEAPPEPMPTETVLASLVPQLSPELPIFTIGALDATTNNVPDLTGLV